MAAITMRMLSAQNTDASAGGDQERRDESLPPRILMETPVDKDTEKVLDVRRQDEQGRGDLREMRRPWLLRMW